MNVNLILWLDLFNIILKVDSEVSLKHGIMFSSVIIAYSICLTVPDLDFLNNKLSSSKFTKSYHCMVDLLSERGESY